MRFTVLASSLVATSMVSAAVPIGGWYDKLFGGVTYLPANISAISPLGVFRDGTSYRGGFNAGGGVGYFSNPIRYEGEYTFLQARTSGFNADGIFQYPASGHSTANLLMFNIYYDTHDVMPCISSFLGLGIGYAVLQTSLNSYGPFASTFFNVHENTFAYQGTAGLTYNFVENYALNLAYRYVAASETGHYGKRFQAHLANVGVIYRFDCVDNT